MTWPTNSKMKIVRKAKYYCNNILSIESWLGCLNSKTSLHLVSYISQIRQQIVTIFFLHKRDVWDNLKSNLTTNLGYKLKPKCDADQEIKKIKT